MAMECLAKVAVAAPSCVALGGASPSAQLAYSSPSTASLRLSYRPCLQAARMANPSSRRVVVAMASPSSNIGDKLSQSIKEAEELCAAEGGAGGECAAAWDEVEELSAEIAHKRAQNSAVKDPLEQYCKDSPEADECRVYED